MNKTERAWGNITQINTMSALDRLTESAQDTWDRAVDFSRDNRAVAGLAGAGIVAGVAWLLLRPSRDRRKPGAGQLSGGSINRKQVKKEFQDYSKAYSTEAGEGIIERSRTTELVDTFYNLVTDIYEWGWGQVRVTTAFPHAECF
jgi:24-methylenesterol C-methyltransferase